MGRNHRITEWNPEDTGAWEAGNNKIARRNLLCTVAGDHVAFSIWTLWSVMALFMPMSVYGFNASDKLLLGAVAALTGGCARIPYTLGIAKFGGRNWTTFSAFVLLIPTVGTIVLLANPGLPLWPYVACAGLTGLGGGNYAASLANVNAFYPQRLKGTALAINAGVGNLGVAGIQLTGLLALATAGHQAPYWVCAVYLVLLTAVGIAAALFMDNLDHGLELNHMRSILFDRDAWVISLLYICTFGSWIGFSFAFAQVLEVNFMANGESVRHASLHAAEIAFVGPLLGSLARIYGGRLADRRSGGRVTLGVFVGMIVGAGLLVGISTVEDRSGTTSSTAVLGYVIGFIVLFVLSGMGNGSVFKLIPSVFEARSRALEAGEAERRQWSRVKSGSLIGICSAVGAFGGVGINLVLRESYLRSGTETGAYWLFLASYLVAAILTWAMYVRRPASARHAPSPVLETETETASV
ncbi:nitrate/nitrite transporter [Mycobacterium montefiorense]|uniref:MFS transporter n=1 Tax=Mycobacterium montefiorense TaxID=154654 RepID=A0ABQ0NMH1_9MYCO|nr:nitrate/nitrite transporter [Mycobacterium montefiorense]GBG38090.1 MFS transporter [Mycobacterium montefiorense]GKU33760.1 MFS transporter [Mycobacterium montefiorense]GKU39880.1 MFS transporter [Mycobacterium montefiorense]GKU43685.1 MFS transporter [Mycobacterium montefiorense]GKU53317.1 MFS transporter [Mycobacterium montefiorense]